MMAAALIGGGAQVVTAIDGAAIVYGLNTPSEESFQRILKADSVRYVCFQQIFSKAGVSPLARKRAEALAKAGKRLVLQIWWGPGGDYPWSKYSFANIALDESVRADFLREVVDACIDQFGAQNLYGVHLMEETGMQFGTDVDKRSDPEDFWTFEEDGQSYHAPFWSGYGDLPGGAHIPNVRRHEKDFTRMTGLGFTQGSGYLFDRWVSVRLQSGGQVEFAKHLHRKYPKLKAFTWDGLYSGGENTRTDYHLEGQYFDGVICDIYNNVNFNFLYQRPLRLLCPKAEIIHFANGGEGGSRSFASPDQKRALTLGAYLAGVDVVGFFENPMDYTRPESWEVNCDIYRRMKNVPRFRKQPSLLLLANSVGNIYSCTYAWTGLKYCDFLPTWEAHDVDLSRYEAVILHVDGPMTDSLFFWNSQAVKEKYGLPGHLDYRQLDKFVTRGGVLILSGQMSLAKDCPLFVVREGYLHTEGAVGERIDPLIISSQGWLRDKLRLQREYRLWAYRNGVVYDPKRVTETAAGYFLRHGKGAVFLLPFNCIYDPQQKPSPIDSPQWQDYRQLLTDTARGVLQLMGKGNVAKEYLADATVGNYYMQASSDDRRLTGYILWNPALIAKRQWRIAGRDLFTGVESTVLESTVLCGDATTALIRSRGRGQGDESTRRETRARWQRPLVGP